MTKAMWLAGTALFLLCGPVVAQTAAPDPAVQTGVLVFDPAFFADSRPDTALDMIARLPGFNFDGGNSETRGLAGTAGNVLIDGARPSTKSDGLGDILGRISAAGVARIELIRGGSPGIDMQGQAVVANVILLRTVTTERVFETEADILADGKVTAVENLQMKLRGFTRQVNLKALVPESTESLADITAFVTSERPVKMTALTRDSVKY